MEEIYSFEMIYDWDVFNEGKSACEDSDLTGVKNNNPYQKNTNNWYNWNKGWNSVY